MTTLHSVAHQCAGGYSAEQLEAIKLFGRKDLKFGSLLLISADKDCDELYSIGDDLYGNTSPKTFPINISEKEIEFMQDYGDSGSNYFKRKVIGILGHIPHLEDLFRVAEEKRWNICIYEDSIIVRDKVKRAGGFKLNVCPKEHLKCEYNPTIPLLEQSEETLNQLIFLFK